MPEWLPIIALAWTHRTPNRLHDQRGADRRAMGDRARRGYAWFPSATNALWRGAGPVLQLAHMHGPLWLGYALKKSRGARCHGRLNHR
jgi:hypothetical protein